MLNIAHETVQDQQGVTDRYPVIKGTRRIADFYDRQAAEAYVRSQTVAKCSHCGTEFDRTADDAVNKIATHMLTCVNNPLVQRIKTLNAEVERLKASPWGLMPSARTVEEPAGYAMAG